MVVLRQSVSNGDVFAVAIAFALVYTCGVLYVQIITINDDDDNYYYY